MQGLRIDYVLASPGLLDKVVSCEVLSAEVLPPKWSDHAGKGWALLRVSGKSAIMGGLRLSPSAPAQVERPCG